jgi:hypothetical protein
LDIKRSRRRVKDVLPNARDTEDEEVPVDSLYEAPKRIAGDCLSVMNYLTRRREDQ